MASPRSRAEPLDVFFLCYFMVSLRCGEVFDFVSAVVIMALVMKRESPQTFFKSICVSVCVNVCVCVCVFTIPGCKTFYTLFPNVIVD